LTPAQAAELYRCFLLDTIDRVRALRGVHPYFAHTPGTAGRVFRSLAADFGLVTQRGRDLGARMAGVLGDLLAAGHPGAIVMGSDVPTLPAATLRAAAGRVIDPAVDVVVGPSADGGYYLVGMRRVHAVLFEAMPWSTPQVLAETERRARRARLAVARVPAWFDVDTPRDLERLRVSLGRGEGGPAPRTGAFLRAWTRRGRAR
jgi:rSAM/selenodomain-associated transferase 1